jgi:mono/diheme cytochrome c family protein
VALAWAVLALGGCDLQEDNDLARGEQLFQANCARCHALNAIGNTTTDIGPNLDAAFAAARADGMDQDSIEGVVQSQIANPRPASPDEVDVYMPADLVEGQDAEDLAAYVASVAGVPGIEAPGADEGPGAQVFIQNGCGGCHVLEALGTSGATGPNLDDNIPGQSPKEVEESIIDPEKTIVKGFPGGVMPANYGDTIPPEDLKELVDYLLESAGKGGSGGGGK